MSWPTSNHESPDVDLAIPGVVAPGIAGEQEISSSRRGRSRRTVDRDVVGCQLRQPELDTLLWQRLAAQELGIHPRDPKWPRHDLVDGPAHDQRQTHQPPMPFVREV